MKNKNLVSFLGFIFFILGFGSIGLSLVGINLTFLLWMEYFGTGIGFLLKIIMTLIGFILIYLAQTNWGEENEQESI